MLQIRERQVHLLEELGWGKFEDEMVTHSQVFSPKLCAVLGEPQLRVAVRQTIKRARGHGFTNRGPVRLFVEMMFLFGSAFDTDPQYPWAAEILAAPDDQMSRAELLFDRIVDYQAKVSGPGDENSRNALRVVLELTRKPLVLSQEEFRGDVLAEMRDAFPQKTAYVGLAGMSELVRLARSEGLKYDFPVRGWLTLAVLMFAFGHGCTRDPLVPWIEATLNDDKIVDGPARAARLEKKAVTWLEHVLIGFRDGEQR